MIIFADILSTTIVLTVPLLLVALGGMFSERSGTINIALEGIMVVGALCCSLFLSALAKTEWAAKVPQLCVFLGILIAAASGMLFSLLLAFASINLKADQTIGGTALNMMAPAIAVVISWAVQGEGQTYINIPTWISIKPENFGLTASASRGFWEELIFKSFYLTTPVAIVLLIASCILLYKTKFGLRLMACGEHPQAADSVGINVKKIRYAGVLISGAFAGIGGFAYIIAVAEMFNSNVAGWGFLALAVMIFGNWKPLNILFAAILFAAFKTIGNYASSIPFLPHFEGVKNAENIYYMLPYIITMIVLAFTSKRSRAPKAEGIPYDKGKR